MRIYSLLNAVFGFIVFATCYRIPMKASAFTYRRMNQKHRLTLKTDKKLDSALEIDTDLPTTFIEKLKSNIEKLEQAETSSDLDLKSMEENIELDNKQKRNTRTFNKRRPNTNRKRPFAVHDILNAPTNTMRANLRSKTGLFLRMSETGELNGTWNMDDKNTIFIIERMSKDAVRLKGEAAQKYICITKRRKIVTREKPIPKCLLRNYLEENYYELFWSYLYSQRTDGENGWFLALRGNGKIRKPSRTKIGDKQTMFYVNRVMDDHAKR